LGYDVYITRAENWYYTQGFEISSLEWLNIVKNDPELVHKPENGEFFVKWSGPTKYPDTWFDWLNGNIYTKYPDKATLRKMSQIAHRLNAKIQGDEGELYDEENIVSFDDSFLEHHVSSKSHNVRKIFLLPLVLFLILFVVFIILLIIEIYLK
jgi:hypothetical protein